MGDGAPCFVTHHPSPGIVRGGGLPADDVVKGEAGHVDADPLVNEPALGWVPPQNGLIVERLAGAVPKPDGKLGPWALRHGAAHAPDGLERRQRPARPDLAAGDKLG